MGITKIEGRQDLDIVKRRYREDLGKYKYQVLVCGGSGCLSSKCGEVKEAFEKLTHVNQLENQVAVIETGCIGICAVGPVLLIMPDEILYTELDAEKVVEIFQSHIVEGQVKEEYTLFNATQDRHIPKIGEIDFFRNQVKIALKNCGLIDHSSIKAYIAHDGYYALSRALDNMSNSEVSEEVKKTIVCQADDGDPKTSVGRTILEGDPHCVIEGMILTGYASGATKGYIHLSAEYPLAVERLEAAIEEARSYGILGKEILESSFSFDIEISIGEGAYICGEDSSLAAFIQGKRGEPQELDPFSPAIIHSAQTLAHVPQSILKGAELYTQYGAESNKGTMVFSLVGDIVNEGIIEVPTGISLGDILYNIGGGIPHHKSFKAAQIGGSYGEFIPKSLLNTPVGLNISNEMKCSRGLNVMSEDSCMVDKARQSIEFIQEQSCGK